ncbi:MAG: hypothetical protein QG670_2457 [Thermoproteota archaeon]|nr:hypothetical protein [Thermoproteota archaeon]
MKPMPYRRKLQRIGETFYISIPKKLVEQLQLDQLNEVDVFSQADGSITVYQETENSYLETTLSINVDESKEALRRKIIGTYVDGYDIIRLKSRDKFSDLQRDTIRNETKNLFGLEAVEMASNSITLQCLTEVLPIKKTIQSIQDMLCSMLSEIHSSFEEKNPKIIESTLYSISDVRRLSLVVHRLLRRQILFPSKRTSEMKTIYCVDFLRVIDKMMEISEEIKRIAKVVSINNELSVPQNIQEAFLQSYLKVKNSYEISFQALMSKDVPMANNVLDEVAKMNFDNLWKQLIEVIRISPSTFFYLNTILDSLQHIHACTLNIAEIAIDLAEYD